MKPSLAFVAPHRTGFLFGTLLLTACGGWWMVEILARQLGISLEMAVPPMFLHGYVMLYGFFPLFILGFLYTAGPRWLDVPAPSLSAYAPVMVGYASGTLLALLGGWFERLLGIGILLHLLSWAGALALWLGCIRASKVANRWHAILMAAAFACGLAGQAVALAWRAGANFELWQMSIDIAVWGFLLPVFLVVSHRMIPFFSGNALIMYAVWHPSRLLFALVGLSWAHGILTLLELPSWPLDLVFTCLLAYTSWRWRLLKSFKVPLLAMLHASFAWAAISLGLYTVQGLAALFDLGILGFAPLHALTLGLFTTMLLGFATRVSLGHSGRPLVAGRLAWTLYWLAHCITLARVIAEILPKLQQGLYLFSAIIGALAFLAWGTRFVPIYLKPRADGKEG